MSNIGNLTRTDAAAPSRYSARTIATVIASALFTIMLVSFRPFQPTGALAGPDSLPSEGGDIVNQVGFLSLGMVAIFSLLGYVDRQRLVALLSPWWLLLLGFFVFSVLNAANSDAATRASIFTFLAIVSIAAVVSLPRDADAFSTVVASAGFVVVGLSFIGLVVVPGAAMHTGNGVEPEFAGLWRGVFSHKNVAGPVMACLSFGGIYLLRRGWTKAGIALFAGAMIFTINTGSKTTAGLVPLSILIEMMPTLIGMRLLTPILMTIALVGFAAGTLGIVFIEPLKELANSWVPGLDYTGRTALWDYAGHFIAERPWTGYGFQSFWGSPLVTQKDQFFDDAWDIRGVVHGHDGYIDIALQMGLPGLVVAVFAFAIAPMRDYMRIPLYKENVYLGDLFMMIVLFTTLNAFLESFFLRRADPVWLLLVFGLLGLRISARFPIRARVPDDDSVGGSR